MFQSFCIMHVTKISYYDFIWFFLVLSPMHYQDPKTSLVLMSIANSENLQLIQMCDLDF